MFLFVRKVHDIEDGSTKLNRNYCFMLIEGSTGSTKLVKFMISSNPYNLKDFEAHLEKIS